MTYCVGIKAKDGIVFHTAGIIHPKLRSKDFEFIKDRDERCRLDIRR